MCAPPLLLPGDASPLCLLNTSSFLDESRVSDPGPWKIHQSKCHLVSLMTSLIAQHVLLSQTSTVTCDYHEYFTHSPFTLNVRSSLKLADAESILAQEQFFPVRLAPCVSLNWLHPNHETKFSPFHSHHEAATYSKITFSNIEFSKDLMPGSGKVCVQTTQKKHLLLTASLFLCPSSLCVGCVQRGLDVFIPSGGMQSSQCSAFLKTASLALQRLPHP